MNGQRQPQVERTGRSEAAHERFHRRGAYPLPARKAVHPPDVLHKTELNRPVESPDAW
jgi:hypothetical protein